MTHNYKRAKGVLNSINNIIIGSIIHFVLESNIIPEPLFIIKILKFICPGPADFLGLIKTILIYFILPNLPIILKKKKN